MNTNLMKPILINNPETNSSLEKEMNSIYIDITDSPYSYNGVPVPRVTHILSEMIHDDYLMDWANYVGRYKRQNHNDIRDNSAYIGTCVHAAIEKYVSSNFIDTFSDISNISDRIKIKKAFHSFKEWWDIIKLHNYEVIYQEKELVCPYYGGTLDMLLRVDNRVYLVDFKTSNHFNYKYHLQTAAYRHMLYYEFGIVVDGIIILKLSKDKVFFEEQVIDLTKYGDLLYINQCDQMFMSLVYSYYNRKTIEKQYSNKYNV